MLVVIICVLLVLLTYQDISKQEVNVILLLAIIMVQAAIGIQSIGLQQLGMLMLTNVTLSVLQFLLLKFYFSVIRGEKGFIDVIIGKGDLIFWLFLCEAFSLLNLFFFITIALTITLVVHLSFHKRKDRIPLIGYLSISYMATMLFCQLFEHDGYDDTFIIHLIL